MADTVSWETGRQSDCFRTALPTITFVEALQTPDEQFGGREYLECSRERPLQRKATAAIKQRRALIVTKQDSSLESASGLLTASYDGI